MVHNLRAGELSTALGMDVVVHESIDSTNAWCLLQCRSGKVLPFACFAEEQTAGRGRRGKHWVMSAQSNIAMSLAWPFDLLKQPLHLLSLTVALAIAETLESMGLKHVQVKWPNDVYVQGKKIAGVLIETRPLKQNNDDVHGNQNIIAVIGIGLNYDMSMYEDGAISDAANDVLVLTDICNEVMSQLIEIKPERNFVALRLLQTVVDACQTFKKMSGINLEKFRVQYDFCKNKNIEVLMDDQKVLKGVALGVNDNAELLLLIDGEVRAFNSAEISVKAAAGKIDL